jgi:hypothetical protein
LAGPAAFVPEKAYKMLQSSDRAQITFGIVLKNNHKGYIGCFTNTVSYSV